MSDRRCENYGKRYWCIAIFNAEEPERPTELYVMADEIVVKHGDLFCLSAESGKVPYVTLCFAKGQWLYYYTADPKDNTPVAVTYWTGQV